ncbi:hypothetical protein B0H13DRAFT_1853504 [Mycena leptocephala]|nr:hypothetical protein B0H13DRAFT_1853504 [Mycena leptocephala]
MAGLLEPEYYKNYLDRFGRHENSGVSQYQHSHSKFPALWVWSPHCSGERSLALAARNMTLHQVSSRCSRLVNIFDASCTLLGPSVPVHFESSQIVRGVMMLLPGLIVNCETQTTSPSIVHQCYRDPHAVLETVRQTCRTAVGHFHSFPFQQPTNAVYRSWTLPLPAQVSDTHPVITHDIEGTSSTVGNNSEIMKRMWRKFRAAQWVAKARIPIPSNNQSGIERYQCCTELLHEMERSIQRADFITFAGTYSIIADPKIDNKERVFLVSTHLFKILDVRRSQSLPYFEQNSALRRYVMLSSCALEPTETQAPTGWIRILAEDDGSHRCGDNPEDTVVDSIHVQPAKTLQNGTELPRFDTAL